MRNFIKGFVFFAAIVFLTNTCAFAADYDSDAVSKYNDGVKAYKDGDYQAATTYFNKAIELDPNFLDSYYNLGVLYEYQKDYDNAMKILRTLVAKNPGDDEAKIKLADLYYKKGEYAAAMSYLSSVPKESRLYSKAQGIYSGVNIKYQQQKSASQPKKQLLPAAQVNSSKHSYSGFNGPTGMAKDGSGNLYVANYSSNNIVKISPNGQRKIVVQGAPLNGPLGLAVDTFSNIYVANYMDNKVLRINTAGKVETLISNIQKPYYLYIDKSNNLFVSEQGTGSILKYQL